MLEKNQVASVRVFQLLCFMQNYHWLIDPIMDHSNWWKISTTKIPSELNYHKLKWFNDSRKTNWWGRFWYKVSSWSKQWWVRKINQGNPIFCRDNHCQYIGILKTRINVVELKQPSFSTVVPFNFLHVGLIICYIYPNIFFVYLPHSLYLLTNSTSVNFFCI